MGYDSQISKRGNMTVLTGIDCTCKEYRLQEGNKWKHTFTKSFKCNELSIRNIVDSSPYYTDLGGYMSIEYTKNRRFGQVVKKIACVSICEKVKRIYTFCYNSCNLAYNG